MDTTTVSDILKREIKATGRTSYAIAKDCAGLSPQVINRFVRGEREITSGTFDRLCRALDLTLVKVEPPKPQQPDYDSDKKVASHGF